MIATTSRTLGEEEGTNDGLRAQALDGAGASATAPT
jgi:hypothetical protein